ncbi:MAG: tetratricopeptide repeat-containing protein [Oceanococcaceae bacterium]
MNAAAPLVIGVTGHLLLNAQEREQVKQQVHRELQSLRTELEQASVVTLISGLAPGADLVLTRSLLEGLQQLGVDCLLTAVIVDSPEELLRRWQQRAEQLGTLIAPESVHRVSRSLQACLDRAHRQVRLMSSPDAPDSGFAQLAALLGESVNLLFAVLRPGHLDGAAGSQQTVTWWQHPEQIPTDLRWNHGRREATVRRLVCINPSPGSSSQQTELIEDIQQIRARLQAGNPLAANDIAARLLRKHPQHLQLRYLFLLSLAQCGSTLRALRLWRELAPAQTLDEDWLALPGRLHKDLAFSGMDPQRNLQQAAAHYRDAHAASGGFFSAINAASLLALAGDNQAAEALAREVLEVTSTLSTSDPISAFFQHASHAEACAVLGDAEGCAQALSRADPWLRSDLSTRARTRMQVGRVLRARGLEANLTQALAMPQIYILEDTEDPAVTATVGPPTGPLARALEASPVYALAYEGQLPPTFAPLLDLGVRAFVHLPEHAKPSELVEAVESCSQLRGFQPQEKTWEQGLSARHLRGLAAIHARQLGVDCVGLRHRSSGGWALCDAPIPSPPEAPPGRQMVGLIFTDLVGFSRYSDAAVVNYWKQVVPVLAQALSPWKSYVLLQQTWGDAIHIVTRDVRSAAEITQVMLATIRGLRGRVDIDQQRLEMRIGAHFAPSWQAEDAIQSLPTWFGSQLSLTARVEPITPPGTTFVTEAFAAELTLVDPHNFRLEYAGEVALAKRYGQFRLYSLHRTLAGATGA